MGLLDTLLTSKAKSEEESFSETQSSRTAKEDITRQETTTIGQTEEERRREEETQRGETETERVLSQLSAADLEGLRSLTNLLSAGVAESGGAAGEQQLATIERLGTSTQALQDRAAAIPDVIDQIVSLSQEAATGEFERTTGRAIEGTIEQAGSGLNTFAELLRGEGRADLSSRLAGIEAQTRLGGENLIADLLSSAVSGNVAAAGALTDLQGGNASRALAGFELLRGAETRETGQETQDVTNVATGTREAAVATEAQTLETILRNLIEEATTTTTGVGTTRSSARQSPISALTGLIGAFS